ncbi:hypothetical protein BJX96DRAFT_182387 [Aspergillus floccosus]
MSSNKSTGIPNWKPLPFRPLYLFILIALHVASIAGIQIVVSKHGQGTAEIDLVRQNTTSVNPHSIFIFEEDSATTFLAWQYLPVAIATVVGLCWEILDVTVRKLEPFHQLSSVEGGDWSSSIGLDYVAQFSLFVPFIALKNRHYAVAVAASVYILSASIIPSLTGAMWSIEWGSLSYSSERVDGPKYATISINHGFAIATQALHGIVAAGGLVLLFVLWHRRTGLYHDPRGIGGPVSLISEARRCDSKMLTVFGQLPSFSSTDVLARSLKGIRFRLKHMSAVREDGTLDTAYQLAADSAPTIVNRSQDSVFHHNRTDASGLWLQKRAVWGAEIFLWLGQAAIAAAIYKVARVVGPDNVADRMKPTIAKMVYTLCTTIGGMMWQSVQRDVQLFEPWRQLARGRAGSALETLVERDVSRHGVVHGGLLSLRKGWLVSMWASFAVLMVHVATVFIPPLLELVYTAGMVDASPFKQREIAVLTGSKGLALAITGIAIHLVIFCNLVFLLLSGRTRPFMPRRPATLASQILYVCRSDRLLNAFAHTSMASDAELAQHLSKYGGTYRFGWFLWPWRRIWFVAVEEQTPGAAWREFDFIRGTQDFQYCIRISVRTPPNQIHLLCHPLDFCNTHTPHSILHTPTPYTMDPEELHRLLQTDIRIELPSDTVARIITQPPFVSVPGFINVRDISSVDSAVRRGVAYRSAAPPVALSTEAQSALVHSLGVTTIFDLRRPLERAKLPNPVIDGVQTVWLPYAFEAPPPSYADFGGGDGGMESFTRLYRSYLDTHVPIYKKVFEHIRDRPHDPFLFHCSGLSFSFFSGRAGKDRTGVLAALILRVAGCPDAAILHDYMLTRAGIEPARPRLSAMLQAHHGVEADELERTGMAALFGVQMQGMLGFLRALDEIGGAERYLHMRLGLSEDDVRVIQANLRVDGV